MYNFIQGHKQGQLPVANRIYSHVILYFSNAIDLQHRKKSSKTIS
jgi:hypothetical protein